MPLHILDVLRVPREHTHAGVLEHVIIILLKNPYALITRTRRHIVPIGAPCYALDLVLMPLKLLKGLKITIFTFLVPEACCRVEAGAGEDERAHLAMGFPGQRPYRPRVAALQRTLQL